MRIKVGHLRQIIREVAGIEDIKYKRAYDEALEAWNRRTTGKYPGREPWEIIQRHLAERPEDQNLVIDDIRREKPQAAVDIENYRETHPGPPHNVVDPGASVPGDSTRYYGND